MIRQSRQDDEGGARPGNPQDAPADGSKPGSGEPRGPSSLILPPRIPRQSHRPSQHNIPDTNSERDQIRRLARQRVERLNLVPPLTVDELRRHAEEVCKLAGADPVYRDHTAVIVNNEAWRDTVAGIPFKRRLLLLPQCLRAEGCCPAPIDEFGLVCQGCGECMIHSFQTEAERLGYAVLVAEGSAVVTKMIETGQIEAVIGVSCMSVLEKCFPHMESRAVPGLAVPLLQDGCASTSVDSDWVWDAIHLTSDDVTYRLDLGELRRDVQSWFTDESLRAVLGAAEDKTEQVARDWLTSGGKRWRPYLAACVHVSLKSSRTGEPPPLDDDAKKLAIAVECFHKASLVHDDIEDDDDERYGKKTLHVEHGMPVALNVGDFLLGEGYRLIGELGVDDATKVAMYHIAASGHLTLSRGQGAELCWARRPRPLASLDVLDIFRQKTAPAFEVALRLGACYSGADEGLHSVLTRYSEALGIAYQIRDDLEDFTVDEDSGNPRGLCPSLVLAVAHKRAGAGAERKLTTSLWERTRSPGENADDIKRLLAQRGVFETVEGLLDAYTAQATDTLRSLNDPALKGLLRRVIGKIFGNEQIQGYCLEYHARHASGSEVGSESVA